MPWSVQNPPYNDVNSYTAILTHTNGVSVSIKYVGSGQDPDADVATAFTAAVDALNADADFTFQNASRGKLGIDAYTP